MLRAVDARCWQMAFVPVNNDLQWNGPHTDWSQLWRRIQTDTLQKHRMPSRRADEAICMWRLGFAHSSKQMLLHMYHTPKGTNVVVYDVEFTGENALTVHRSYCIERRPDPRMNQLFINANHGDGVILHMFPGMTVHWALDTEFEADLLPRDSFEQVVAALRSVV